MNELLHPVARSDAAAWIADAITGARGLVGGIVPTGFEAHARVLHRAGGPDGVLARWAQVAARTQRQVHRRAQFQSIAARSVFDARVPSGWPGENPQRGSLDAEQFHALCRVLAEDSSPTQTCYLLLWDGWGNLPSRWREEGFRIRQPARNYLMFECRISDVFDASIYFALPHPAFVTSLSMDDFTRTQIDHADPGQTLADVQSPNQWWSADRSWFVSTEIDYDSTIVAGTQHLITQIVTDPQLEAFQVDLGDDLSADGDTINPTLM